VQGLSENIRALSIIDRFLEHARVYHFANNGTPETLVSSGDLMPRNLDHRIEVAFPIVDPIIASQIVELMELQLHDTVKGRMLGQDGRVLRRGLDADWPPLRSQYRTYEHGLLASGAKDITRKLPDLKAGDIG